MAKVGNEAKLILRLARERMEPYSRGEVTGQLEKNFVEGFKAGVSKYTSMLDEIVSELEGK